MLEYPPALAFTTEGVNPKVVEEVLVDLRRVLDYMCAEKTPFDGIFPLSTVDGPVPLQVHVKGL